MGYVEDGFRSGDDVLDAPGKVVLRWLTPVAFTGASSRPSHVRGRRVMGEVCQPQGTDGW